MAEEKKEEGGFFANLFNFGGGAPAAAPPEPAATPDVTDPAKAVEPAASSAEAEKAKWLLSLEPAQI